MHNYIYEEENENRFAQGLSHLNEEMLKAGDS
jgi:hypothetical protein